MSLPISECATKYATAIADPWSPEAEGSCIPTFPSRPSQKVTSFGRLTVTIGTQGFGFAVFAPCLANDAATVYYSTVSYTGTTVNTGAGVTPGVSSASMTNLPYGYANFIETNGPQAGDSVAGRIVSFGASAQYTGTELDRGGLYYLLTEPLHTGVDGDSLSTWGSYRECDVERITEKKVWITAFGQSAMEVQYPDDYATISAATETIRAIYPYSRLGSILSNSSTGMPIMGIMFTGKAGNTFEVEMVIHVELCGRLAQAMLTPTHSDARGFEIVQQAAGNLQQKRVEKPKSTIKTLLFDGVREIAGLLGAAGAPVAREMPLYLAGVQKGIPPQVMASYALARIARDKGFQNQVQGALGRLGKAKKNSKRGRK